MSKLDAQWGAPGPKRVPVKVKDVSSKSKKLKVTVTDKTLTIASPYYQVVEQQRPKRRLRKRRDE